MADTTTKTSQTLDALAGDGGTFAIIAMDQRNTLRRMFAAEGFTATDQDIRDAKADVARALTPAATGMLLDPTLGVPGVSDAGALAPGCGLLVAAEPEERISHNGAPRVTRLAHQNATWVRDMGGDALKFYIQLRADWTPERGESDLAAEALDVVREIVEDCQAVGMPAVIENLIFTYPGEAPLSPGAREDAIVEAARALNDLDIDLLKLEYPGSPAGCRRLSEALTRPWAVLSAGVPFEEFEKVTAICYDEGGASGFIAGRSLWKEAVGLTGAERTAFLNTVSRSRLEKLLEASAGRARPWTDTAASPGQPS
jgi:tagatose-1,6-bisphosphate aldolase